MRAFLITAFLLQVSFTYGQIRQVKILTLDDALTSACNNNPSVSDSGDQKKLSLEIKSAWYLWLYRINKWQTQQMLQHELGDLDRVASLRFESGDTDLSGKLSMIGRIVNAKTSTAISANEIEISRNTIMRLLFLDDSIIPADTGMAMYRINKGNEHAETGQLFPNKSPRKDTALEQYSEFARAKTIEIMELELDNLFIRLQFFTSFGLINAENIYHTAQAKFSSEEIDYPAYTESLEKAFEIRLDYLETLNRYNQNAIQLEYYAY